jgi:hypothetical protein
VVGFGSKRSPSFKHSILNKQASGMTALVRHSIKGGTTSSGVTFTGLKKAFLSGKGLPKDKVLHITYGEQARHKGTAEAARRGHVKSGGRFGSAGPTDVVGMKWLKTTPEATAIVDKYIAEGGKNWEAKYFADWYAGKMPTVVMEPPAVIGKAILKEIIPKSFALIKSSSAVGEKPLHLVVGSQILDAAILEALGINYLKFKPNNQTAKKLAKLGSSSMRFNEGLLFYHLPNKRTILRYRGRAFDVTEPLQHALMEDAPEIRW